ncbi:MAG: hypothetical protein E4H01_01735 [Lysobacterales bacterium]|nr:MAG: hypothetical protein E4H01_01735 [Xanthomonadales bacterium]
MKGTSHKILQKIQDKTNMDELVSDVLAEPHHVEILVETLRHERSALKFGCEKVLRLVSEQKPELIYPYFDFFVALISSENSFLRWGAIRTLANLVSVDAERRFDKVFSKYFSNITGGDMVSAANAIGSSPKIAQARPELADRIVHEILKLEGATYLHKGRVSPECKNVVRGAAVGAFEAIYPIAESRPSIARFLREQTENPRTKVRASARKVLGKLNIER